MERYTDQDIDDFILDQMGAEEHRAFCENLEKDKELREKVALRQLIVEAERCLAEKEARKGMEQKPQKRLGLKRLSIVSLVVAASLIGIVLIIGYTPKYSTQEIFQDYYSIPAIERPRGGASLTPEDAVVNNQIITHFNRQEYDQVIMIYQQQWEQSIPEHIPASTLLYVSISYIEHNHPADAVRMLHQMSGDPDYMEEVQWLLLCSYLRMGDKDQALLMTDEIVENGTYYTGKAKEIGLKLKQRTWF